MKLRNKKTGEVWNVWSFYDEDQTINLKYFNNDEIVIHEYRSLAELNEEWEDYEPIEPLIKDEKIISFISMLERIDRKLSKLCGEEEE